ncbi:UNVERIFIED_CONTAM: hypothetical protein GTU68_020090, partial [Idotea baltica]|nr:hypothetical protein [Idotea baltica]
MGANLALNMAEKGAVVALYDMDSSKSETLVAENFPGQLIGCQSLPELVKAVRAPRPIVLLAPAGKAVDDLIAALSPLIEEDDILIDAGNSDYHDTRRRAGQAEAAGYAFLGMGVSGGAEGARHGPAMMAGGSPGVWSHATEIADVISGWLDGPLNCYLVDISAQVLRAVDPETGSAMVDVILDCAGQKGTGLWTAVEAQILGAPATTVEAALMARSLSSKRGQRAKLEAIYGGAPRLIEDEGLDPAAMLQDALIVGKIIAYAQGFSLIEAASERCSWGVKLPDVARVWRAGCIIRTELLDGMAAALAGAAPSADLPPLLGSKLFSDMVREREMSLRATVATSAVYGLACPALSAALGWFDMARTGRGTANLIQAQRDFFGAHGF